MNYKYAYAFIKGVHTMSSYPPKTTPFLLEDEQCFVKKYAGKIFVREEINLNESTLQSLIQSNKFTLIPSIKRNKWAHECQRCHNRKHSLFAEINCARCKTLHVYCRKCIEMGKVLSCESLYVWTGEQFKWPAYESEIAWEGQLTDVQQVAADQIFQAIHSDTSELLVWGVCGAGKTEMLFNGIRESLQAKKRICIATPRVDVVRELLPRFKEVFPNIHIQALYGGSEDKTNDAQFIIATTHQLLRFYDAFDVMIIDEVDAFPYHADPSLPFATKRATKQLGTSIYLTATPRKKQSTKIKQGKLPHVFVPRRFHGHPLPIPQLKLSFSLQKKLQKNVPPISFLSWLKNKKSQTRQLLIFVPTIQLAESMSKTVGCLLVKEKILNMTHEIQAVHADDHDRAEKVSLFRQKKIKILITTTILERGVTFPAIDVVVFDAGHKVFDEAALVQIAGRAGRSLDDPTGEVVFYHDGKTEAMVDATYSIIAMNKRGGFH